MEKGEKVKQQTALATYEIIFRTHSSCGKLEADSFECNLQKTTFIGTKILKDKITSSGNKQDIH